MKIILADDEGFVRLGIKAMLQQLCPDAEIREASNGEEILKIGSGFHPDYVLADIKMPKMSGLEALEQWKEGTDTQWIILSGYSDFEYARKCIQYGVTDYLLKPVSFQELEKVMGLLQAWQTDRRAAVRLRSFRSAGELLDAAQRERFTLYLLDVLMPGVTGMEAAREIRSFDDAADIVFLTTSPGFAYESYGVRALEYLLKPVSAKLLFPLLDRLYQREQNPQDGLTVRSEGVLVRLPFSQLSYVEVMGKHLFFHMTDDSVHEVVGALKEYEGALLARPEFMRTHRSYIVNMLQAEKLSPAGVVTFSGRSVPVSRLLYNQLQKDYLELLFSGRDA